MLAVSYPARHSWWTARDENNLRDLNTGGFDVVVIETF
jgi:hypothetical protein